MPSPKLPDALAAALADASLPAPFAENLRARLEAALPPGYAALGPFCRAWEARVAARLPPSRRAGFWRDVMEGPVGEAVMAGEAARAEALMLAALAAPARGEALLVGAGPGDAALLTLKAQAALRRADVVLYDKLVGPEVLAMAPARARRIDVGKRCGRHSMRQEAINRLLVRCAREGLRVVRLKGGDPFIFGRGGEEMEALREAGMAVETIPGITTAIAAAAALGIPLTHRGLSRGLHLITAHGQDERLPEHDWAGLARSGGTLAVYMGVRTLPLLAARLLAAGMDPATPALAVENATLPGQRAIPASLGTLAERLAEAAPEGPTLLLIGAVIAMSAAMTEEMPLRDAA